MVDYGSEFVLGDSVAALLNAAATVDAEAQAALIGVSPAGAAAAAGTSVVEGSAHVPASTVAAEGTSGAGGGAFEEVAEDTSGDGSGHGSTDKSGDGASAHDSVSTGHDHDAGASQTQDSAEGTTHCSVTSTGFLTLARFW